MSRPMHRDLVSAAHSHSFPRRRTPVMSRRALQLALPVFLLAFLAVAGAAQASEQYFIKITGIPGESTYQNHENEIFVNSFSWNVTTPANRGKGGGGGVGGRPTFSDFTFTHDVDSASPLL